jgi:hypothetical protein
MKKENTTHKINLSGLHSMKYEVRTKNNNPALQTANIVSIILTHSLDWKTKSINTQPNAVKTCVYTVAVCTTIQHTRHYQWQRVCQH